MLVNMNEMLKAAKNGKYAVGLFNAVNMELARGIIAAAEETGSPLIIGTAEIFFPYGPLEDVSYFLIPMAKRAKVPVVVHLDHGLTRESCIKALELGFTSIMYDCSTDPYDVNVSKVKEMAEIAHSYGATIEGELGHVGDNEGSAEAAPAAEKSGGATKTADAENSGGAAKTADGAEIAVDPSIYFTDPAMAKDYVEKTGVDALAIAVGNAHGAYKLPPKLDFDRIKTIAGTVDVPLVLHGGSGLTDDDFKRAINEGISKVNIFTDLNIAAAQAVSDRFTDVNKGILDLIPAQVEAIKQETMKKMRLFDSVGRY